MFDRFGRKLNYLRVSLIDRCNLRCLYCMPNGLLDPFKKEELLNIDEVFEAVSIFSELGTQKVRLTGGEPLLRKGVPGLIARIKSLPGIREVVMTTNGVLLKEFAKDLKAAGLDRINVSLDTLDRENFKRITGLDKLKEVLEGIEAAAREGIRPVKINTVLMKGVNDHEILDLLNYSIEHGFDLRFIEWMPTAAEINSIREGRFMSSETAKHIVEEKCGLIPDNSNPHAPARTFKVTGTDSTVGFISPLSNAFCGNCNRLRLKANGMMKTCLHGGEDLDLRSLLRTGISREEIKKAIEPVVFNRPEEHFLNNNTVAHKDFVMTALGG